MFSLPTPKNGYFQRTSYTSKVENRDFPNGYDYVRARVQPVYIFSFSLTLVRKYLRGRRYARIGARDYRATRLIAECLYVSIVVYGEARPMLDAVMLYVRCLQLVAPATFHAFSNVFLVMI